MSVKNKKLRTGHGIPPGLDSESGMPNVMTYESLKQTLPESALWPQNSLWGVHDYCLESAQGAAYFRCKKDSEPIHIQWNPVYDTIEVVNYNAKDRSGLTARAQILNMDGSVQWEKEVELECKEDFTSRCFRLEFPKNLSSVHFIKLTLKEKGKIISDNFYWRGLEDGNYQALNNLPAAKLLNGTTVQKSGDDWILTTSIKNISENPALMIRLKVVGKTSGERILPVFFSDNYVSLMPGDEKVITMKLNDSDTRGEKPVVEISGFNL